MARLSKRLLLVIIGLLLMALGVLLALPFVPGPGIVLIVIGAALVAGRTDWLKRQWDKVKHRLQEVE